MTRPEPTLRVVTPAAEDDAQAARRFHAEALRRAGNAVERLLAHATLVKGLASDISQDGSLYPPGVREECRQLAAQVSARADTIMAVMGRGK